MFDIHQSIFDKSGELDERKVGDYIDGLMKEFAASPEAKPLFDSGEGVGWASLLMEYAANYCGTTPATMSLADFDEVVFDLLPRKVSTEPESAPAIVNELRAFWRFVDRQYGLGNTQAILAALDASAAERLQKKLADPSNYGMAKSFFRLGQKAGFDMTTQEGLDQFMHVYNSKILGSPDFALPPADVGEEFFAPPDSSPLSRAEREEKRKARKRQRQARKRHRRH